MNILFKQLKHNGIGCHVGPVYAGAFGCADDVALVAPSLYSLKCMIATCEEFAKKHQITLILQNRNCYVSMHLML